MNYDSAVSGPAVQQSSGSFNFETDYVPYGIGLSLGKLSELFIFLKHNENRVCMVCGGHSIEAKNKKRTVKIKLKEMLSKVIEGAEISKAGQ